MKPTVGRIVHFYPAREFEGQGGQDGPYPGIITAVADVFEGDTRVNLVTFGDGSIYFHAGIHQAIDGQTTEPRWAWPARADE